jgi:hypothetical protein
VRVQQGVLKAIRNVSCCHRVAVTRRFIDMLSLVLFACAAAAFARTAAAGDPYPSPPFNCSALPKMPPATDVNHLRPQDIKVIMAVGDSISAGFAMHAGPLVEVWKLVEYRGDVFSIGANPDQYTLPNFFKHYSPNIIGGAVGNSLPLDAVKWKEGLLQPFDPKGVCVDEQQSTLASTSPLLSISLSLSPSLCFFRSLSLPVSAPFDLALFHSLLLSISLSLPVSASFDLSFPSSLCFFRSRSLPVSAAFDFSQCLPVDPDFFRSLFSHLIPCLLTSSSGLVRPTIVAHLNGAQSQAKIGDVPAQVTYLHDQLRTTYNKTVDFENDWKMLTVFIGANNLCGACKGRNYSDPDYYEATMDAIFTQVNNTIPRTFVNVVLIFNISQVHDIAYQSEYCRFMWKDIVKTECMCLQGDATLQDRTTMDLFALEYNKRILSLAAKWQAYNYSHFTVRVQPFIQNLKVLGLEFISEFDCFHVSHRWCVSVSRRAHALCDTEAIVPCRCCFCDRNVEQHADTPGTESNHTRSKCAIRMSDSGYVPQLVFPLPPLKRTFLCTVDTTDVPSRQSGRPAQPGLAVARTDHPPRFQGEAPLHVIRWTPQGPFHRL